MTGAAGPPPLAGYTVAVTADRRADEQAAMLRRRGATVSFAPALRLVPLADDGDLYAATRSLLTDPPDVVIATTGIGFRGLVSAAEAWGLADELRAVLRAASVLSRGPKATGAVRAAGLTEAFAPPSESSAELLAHLLADGVAGRRVAVQWHGAPPDDVMTTLRAAGADVVDLPVYRWRPPDDAGPLSALLDGVQAGIVDAVTFTSAPAVRTVLAHADALGRLGPLLRALRSDCLAACVGPVTAAELTRHGVVVAQPDRFRLGAMLHLLTVALQSRSGRIRVAGGDLEIRGHAVVRSGGLRPVPPAGMALLRVLARRPGAVVPRATLLRALPGGTGDEHAVETAIARLRAALGEPGMIRTVVKRGYRLATDPPATRRGTGRAARTAPSTRPG